MVYIVLIAWFLFVVLFIFHAIYRVIVGSPMTPTELAYFILGIIVVAVPAALSHLQ